MREIAQKCFIFGQKSYQIFVLLLSLLYFCFISSALASSDLYDDEDLDGYLQAHKNSEYSPEHQKHDRDEKGNTGLDMSGNASLGDVNAPIAGTINIYVNSQGSGQATESSEKSSSLLSTIRYIDNYYPRTESANLEDLTKKLEENNIVAITGIAGAGKTQFASYYILEEYNKRYPKNVVFKLLADTQDNLDYHYRKFAIAYLGISKDISGIEDVKLFVKRSLSERMEEGFLLFFDNVDSLSADVITTYFPEKITGKASQIIITSQKNDFFKSKKEKNFHLGSLTEKEAIEFFQGEDRSFTEEEALSLANSFSRLALGTQCAKMYLIINPQTSVDEYLRFWQDEVAAENIEDDQDELISGDYADKQEGYRTQRAAIALAIKQLSPEAQYLLKCCCFFYPDKIPFKLLQGLFVTKFNLINNLSEANIKFNAILKELRDRSLIQALKRPNVSPLIFSTHNIVRLIAKMPLHDDEKKVIAKILYDGCVDEKVHLVDQYSSITLLFVDDISEGILLQVVELFVDAGNDVNQLSERGKKTLLDMASGYGHFSIVKLLLKSGAAPELVDDTDRLSPLMRAAYFGNVEVVKSLIDAKCNVDFENKFGGNALEGAALGGHIETMKMLLAAGANPNKKRTGLLAAVYGNHSEAIKLLLVAGAKTKRRQAYTFAVKKGYDDVAALLADNIGRTHFINKVLGIISRPLPDALMLYFFPFFSCRRKTAV